jgi:2,3-bisphosphoglycerate-dependent phosphoglycerate mutase
MDRVTRVILVRHGQTAWNDGARFQGHLDSPLTDTGIQQAEALGRRLASEQIAAIYSSDLGRALQTAEIIARRTKLSVKSDARLRERSLGIFEGLTRTEVPNRFPEEWQRYISRDPDYIVPGGQSARGHFAAGLECLEELIERHRGERIIVVTHGGLVQGMFRHVTGVPFEAARRFSLQNAAYNVLQHDGREWSVVTWGDVAHFANVPRTGSIVEGGPEGSSGEVA